MAGRMWPTNHIASTVVLKQKQNRKWPEAVKPKARFHLLKVP